MARASLVSRLRAKVRLLGRLGELDKLDSLLEAVGRIEARQLEQAPNAFASQEFTVYSQHGEDGIIQYLLRSLAVTTRTFVEFGVGNYRQANTRYLAINNHWSGLVMDRDAANVREIRADPIFWQVNVEAVHAFVTRENINELVRRSGYEGAVGLLSIDIDGNDYWVYEALTVVNPAIAVIEYNFRFGPKRAVSVPYDPEFDRLRAHPSGIYFGASLNAISNLARRKGYSLVGCNSLGVNAFFVRTDLLNDRVKASSVDDAFVAGQFREARGPNGKLSFINAAEEEKILAKMPLVELDEQGEPIPRHGAAFS